ncbi:MAG: hypothetical protein WBC00_07815 [Candidatus Omnitrophota bacterium]
MKRGLIFLVLVLSFLLFSRYAFTQDDKVKMKEYPDGSYGIDLGDDWQVTPDGDFIGDQATRGEYVDTKYGPTTQEGFLLFPDFHWDGPAAKAAEKKAAGKYFYIYYEATTTTPPEPGEEVPFEEGE